MSACQLSSSPAVHPAVAVASRCGNAYGTARTLTPGSQSKSFLLTHGLHYSEKTGRLYWTFGEENQSSTSNAYFLGYAKPAGIKRRVAAAAAAAAANAAAAASVTQVQAQPKVVTSDLPAFGPWKVAPVVSGDTALHSQKVRGGALEIPQWFADKYLGGRNLGVGFGGYYNDVMKGMSMGPSLVAVRHPNNVATGTLTGAVELLGYGFGQSLITSRYCVRNNNYALDVEEYPWAKNPNRNKTTELAYWAPGDSIEGAAVWVDNGTHHGLLFFPELSQNFIGVSENTNELERIWSMPHW
jgi:hypothetical protein